MKNKCKNKQCKKLVKKVVPHHKFCSGACRVAAFRRAKKGK